MCSHPWKTVFALLLLVSCSGAVSADPSFGRKLSQAAIDRTRSVVIYDGSYRRIPYPNGDVPAHIGVCTDVVIRSYRKSGIDLQQLVHRDMKVAFSRYPSIWGLRKPDTNIDHRRVPNLRVFFKRHGLSMRPSRSAASYREGDIVTWRLPGGRPHIGIVTGRKSPDGKRPLVVHNIGLGPRLEDVLFSYTLTGHYRFHPLGPRGR